MTTDLEDAFEARPSNRIGNQKIEADGDTWQETLAVCEAAPASADAGKLIIRSYYQNIRGKRVWDEPPSGASDIRPASEEMRRMANIQLSELQVVTGGIEENAPETKKKRGFFGFRKKDKTQSAKGERKIQYKSGSKFFAGKGGPQASKSNDAQLQEAIARSIADSRGEPYENPNNLNADIDDEELAMATALSMSVADHYGDSDEQIIQQVIEQSKLDAPAPRGTKIRQNDNLLGISNTQAQTTTAWPEDDRKMPAKSNNTNLPPSSTLLDISSASQYAAAPSAAAAAAAAASHSANEATTTLKAPPSNGSTTLPNSSNSPMRSPVAMFDPYAKDSPAVMKPAPQPAKQQDGHALQKMDETPANNLNGSRLSFGKRTSTKKIQDKAGLV